MRRLLHRLALLTLVGLCPVACNSTPERGVPPPDSGATLEGTVTYGGQKVAVALVIAQGSDRGATGFVSDDGHYKLSNVPLGEVHLAVNTDAGKGQMMSRVMAQGRGKPRALPRVVEVPAKYFDPTTSGIKTTVNPGPNTFDIVIPK
jgi:hypothetical protein